MTPNRRAKKHNIWLLEQNCQALDKADTRDQQGVDDIMLLDATCNQGVVLLKKGGAKPCDSTTANIQISRSQTFHDPDEID
jgi:hypothetical protein